MAEVFDFCGKLVLKSLFCGAMILRPKNSSIWEPLSDPTRKKKAKFYEFSHLSCRGNFGRTPPLPLG